MRWDGPGLQAWQPWSPQVVAATLAGCNAHWCVVGGWAVDLFLGRQTRPHDDLEIAIPRMDFTHVRNCLQGLRLHVVGDGEVMALADDVLPPPDKHQNWVLDVVANAWRMDVMLEPGDADTWVFRRDPSITAPRSRMTAVRDNVPYLQPEGALLYKAKAARPKDEADFSNCLPHLTAQARGWLRSALQQVHPDHAWIDRLGAVGTTWRPEKL